MTRSIAAILLCLSAVRALADSGYRVTVNWAHPEKLTLSADLPQSSAPTKLQVRVDGWGLDPQAESPRCGTTLLQKEGKFWLAPATCREVTWTVTPTAVGEEGVDVSRQASLLFRNPPWILLSESTALLKRVDQESATSLTIESAPGFGATQVSEHAWRLPSWNNAPEYFVIGDVQAETRTVGIFQVRYVADKPAQVERLGLQAKHEQVLGYLSELVRPPAALPTRERTLLIVWVAIDEKKGRAGGTSGSRSFVANYVVGRAEFEEVNAVRTLLVMGHEQFHQLTDLARGSLAPFPVWLNESLATYYGLKALDRISRGKVVESVRNEFINSSRPVTASLIELDRRYITGDASVYPLFYSQGATFWAELDKALHSETNGAQDLDALLPDLLESNPEQDRQLPKAFSTKIRAVLGARADALLAKYVGN
jgi:hypothetical protein